METLVDPLLSQLVGEILTLLHDSGDPLARLAARRLVARMLEAESDDDVETLVADAMAVCREHGGPDGDRLAGELGLVLAVCTGRVVTAEGTWRVR